MRGTAGACVLGWEPAHSGTEDGPKDLEGKGSQLVLEKGVGSNEACFLG